MRRWRTSAVAVAMLFGAGLLATGDRPTAVLASSVSTRPYDFELTAESVTDLYPGGMKYLRVTARNPRAFAVNIIGVRAVAIATSRRHCRPDHNLAVWRFTGPLPQTLGAYQQRTIGALPVSMPLTAASTCPDTTFTIKITGTAVRSGR